MKFSNLLKLCLFFIIAVGSASCGGDDSGEMSDSSIVGAWRRTVNEDGESYSETLSFNAGGTGVITVNPGGSLNFDYTISGDQLTLDVDAGASSFVEVVTYAIAGNTLSLSSAGQTVVYTRVS